MRKASEPEIEARPVEEPTDGRLRLNISIDLTSAPDEKMVWEGVGLILAGSMGAEKAAALIGQMQERLDATPKDGRTVVVSLSQTEEVEP